MAANASKFAIMAGNCNDPSELTLQRQIICTTDHYTYLGYIMNPKWCVAGTIKNNKLEAQKAIYAEYYFLNRSDVLTKLKIRFINSVLLPIGCYGGKNFGNPNGCQGREKRRHGADPRGTGHQLSVPAHQHRP
ncbi:hypothetical protein AYI69_g7490 [Smittium culicis]|uniref:Uncharacterized protein n=1 Tax=Smittium culicis TaxID=133412 RepID=A0A1R1XRN0_9FUNG|nr:hypothetical protein AYI69_g7490 [Smittium culicis]